MLLRMNEAAETLACSRPMLYKLAAAGEIELIKLGTGTRVPSESLDAYIARAERLYAANDDNDGNTPSSTSGAPSGTPAPTTTSGSGRSRHSSTATSASPSPAA